MQKDTPTDRCVRMCDSFMKYVRGLDIFSALTQFEVCVNMLNMNVMVSLTF